MFEIINKLTKISPRYGHDEMRAAKIITDELKSLRVQFKEELFETSVPRIIKAELYADNISISCVGSSLVSGEIKNSNYLVSAFGYTGEKHPYNINYSPITDEISVIDFYRVPALTISRNSVVQVVMAKNVKGSVEVKEERFTTENILAGNMSNPENIVFAHYDSIIGDGALDNAAAISIMVGSIKLKPEILQNTLMVFAGNEEVSYDGYKTKSGYGFRVFESFHGDVIKNSKQIIVIDGIGVSVPSFVQTGLDWVLQMKMLDEIRNRVCWLQNDQSEVLKYFHTKADVVGNLQERYLKEAQSALIKRIS